MNKKLSLKQYLNNEIMREGFLPLDKVHGIALALGHKQSTAERKLRASESPMIRAVKNEQGYIIGYRYDVIKADIININPTTSVQLGI